MKRTHQIATWSGAILGAFFALLLNAHAQDRGRFTEEFHHVYPLSATGRVSLENINGAAHVSTWDRNEVKVDAVKSANTQERLNEAEIRVEAESDSVSIKTEYPQHTHANNSEAGNNPATVEYTLTVPKNVRLDEIKLINGSLDIRGVSGGVRASCINGHLSATDLTGDVKLSTINGTLDAGFVQLSNALLKCRR